METTKIPIPTVEPDKLPYERGWNYSEIATIVGNLYLESRKHVMLLEEQTNAVLSEYRLRIKELEATNTSLRRELERRNESRANVVPDTSG